MIKMEDTGQVTLTDDEFEMNEDLEAMLYSRIHYDYECNYQVQTDGKQNADQLQAMASDFVDAEQHVVSVKAYASKENVTSVSYIQDTQKTFISNSFDSTGDVININSSSDESVTEIPLPLKKAEGKESSKVKSKSSGSESDFCTRSSSVNCDPGKKPKVRLPSQQRDVMSNRVRGEISHQSHVPDVLCLDDLDPFSKDFKPKPKFDLEAELGIPLRPVLKQHRKPYADDSDSEIDTITIKPKAKKCSKSENFIKLSSCEADACSKKSVPGKDYKKSLRQMLISHPVSKKNKISLRETFVVHSDSTSCSSDEDDSDITSRTSSDSDIVVCDTKSNTSSESKKKKSLPSSQLDLNWNVNSVDCQTIKIIEKQWTRVDESKWKIDQADMISSQKSRYYTRREINCNNCNKQGHLSKRCPEPKKKPNCGLCGQAGHMMSRCGNRLCYNCNLPGHTGARCQAPKRDRFAKCPRCLMRGHSEDQCPDQWRQFHSTITTAEDLVPGKEYMNSRVWCSNCAKRGHFVHECRFPLMEKIVFPTCPFIMRYDVASAQQSKSLTGRSGTQSRGRHTKFSSDSELNESNHCDMLKSSKSLDAPPWHARSSRPGNPGGKRNISVTHQSYSAGKLQSQPVYSQPLFPRGRSDKSSNNTWLRQQRYNQHSDSHEFSPAKRHAPRGLEDLQFSSKKPRIVSEISEEIRTKKKAKRKKKLEPMRTKSRESLTINKKQDRNKAMKNLDRRSEEVETSRRKLHKKLDHNWNKTDKNPSQSAHAAGSSQKRKGVSPNWRVAKGGAQPAESWSHKKGFKGRESALSKSQSQTRKKSSVKRKQNNKDRPKLSLVGKMLKGGKESKRDSIAGLVPQCRARIVKTMSGFRSAFLASTSIK